jgi:hypothetical protein
VTSSQISHAYTAVGVALAATSLMDDPHAASTQMKILEFDLRECREERDKLLKWNTELKKQLTEARREKGAYLYSLMETDTSVVSVGTPTKSSANTIVQSTPTATAANAASAAAAAAAASETSVALGQARGEAATAKAGACAH